MQGSNGKLLGCLPSYLVLGAQPLSQPLASMSFDSSIGTSDWSQTEIIRPPNHHSIECRDYCFLGQQGLVFECGRHPRLDFNSQRPSASRFTEQRVYERLRRKFSNDMIRGACGDPAVLVHRSASLVTMMKRSSAR